MISSTRAGNVNAPQAAVFAFSRRSATPAAGRRQFRQNQKRHAVADTALSDLFAQPHDERAARSEGEHGHQDEARTRVVDEVTRLLQAEGNAERLDGAEDDGKITRPLGDLLAPHLAFFLQLGQRFVHHREQLQNNGGGNVGHDAEGENRHPAQVAAAKQVDEAEHTAAVLLEELRQPVTVDAGRGDVSANAVDSQQAQREQHPPAQVGNPEDVRQLFEALLQDLKPAACLGDLLLRRFGELVRVHSERRLFQFAIAENLLPAPFP